MNFCLIILILSSFFNIYTFFLNTANLVDLIVIFQIFKLITALLPYSEFRLQSFPK